MQQRIGLNVRTNSIAHMFRIIKKVVSKKGHVFHAPDNHSNKEVNIDVISNVITFLTLGFKVYSSKTSYFHEKWRWFHQIFRIAFKQFIEKM